MGEIDVGALPVGSADAAAGIVTDRDILYRVVAKGLDPVATRVRDIASRPVHHLPARPTRCHAAMDAMAANHIRRMPVQDPETTRDRRLDHAGRHLADVCWSAAAALQQALRELTEV